MGFGEAIQSVFRNYATFSGRARRSEFWYWQLFSFLTGGALTAVGVLLAFPLATTAGSVADFALLMVFQLIAAFWYLGTYLPGVAVCVRRYHDTNASAWNLAWPLAVVPAGLLALLTDYPLNGMFVLVGMAVALGVAIYQFVLLTSPSDLGSNRYGLQPGAPIEAPSPPVDVT